MGEDSSKGQIIKDYYSNISIHGSEKTEGSLFHGMGLHGGDEDLIYDEKGSFALSQQTSEDQLTRLRRPCSLSALNGSWLLTLMSTRPHFLWQIRGPMRIEAKPQRLRVSGDVYVKPLIILPQSEVTSPTLNPEIAGPFFPGSLVIQKNWYPAFPQSEYRWYFRSTGVKYSKGKLIFQFERHLWNNTSQSFVSQDDGWMEFQCHRGPLIHPIGAPQPTIEMKGTAMVGGTQYNVIATKTSPYYRGCTIEVDVMTNRQWPASATNCDGSQTLTFNEVYQEAGMEFWAVVNEIDVPDVPLLTIPEMHTLLATHRLPASRDNWGLWILVGSRMDNTFGIMFDTGNPPNREGVLGFYDSTLPNIDIIHPSARGKKLGESPLSFLRTLVHEAGHAFNLYHPKHDVHSVPVGTTIMNQTGDVMGFATTANPYPCNAIMGFNDHNLTSLIHSPDPQVKPCWKEFGWGHGNIWSGVAEPVDVLGFDSGEPEARDLMLKIGLPSEAIRGEFVIATVTVTNTGNSARAVTTALNLAEGDLRIEVTTPNGQVIDARDVVVVCGIRRFITLEPGDQFSGTVQVFYGPHGLTFDQMGRYEIRAELSIGDGTVVRSGPVELMIHPAVTDPEREIEHLTMDTKVGLSLALGDFGTDTLVREKLMTVAERFPDTETGAASAMVVANSLARDLRDIRNSKLLRPKDEDEANHILDIALKGRDAVSVARLSTAVVSPREIASPLLNMVQQHINKANKNVYTDDDKEHAAMLITNHLA